MELNKVCLFLVNLVLVSECTTVWPLFRDKYLIYPTSEPIIIPYKECNQLFFNGNLLFNLNGPKSISMSSGYELTQTGVTHPAFDVEPMNAVFYTSFCSSIVRELHHQSIYQSSQEVKMQYYYLRQAYSMCIWYMEQCKINFV
ncbi:hypothetical protein QAD02_011023 [Eretmocerus hayati]|uniref:Uncharacterized protein n=1 Tax=Eretmocerus hayati TaxID=131215 RepID=A0ACC2NYF4_9HYME|nr:hypothetical protein QAD02_011023 [Eretmocerus hayati]